MNWPTASFSAHKANLPEQILRWIGDEVEDTVFLADARG